MKYLILALALCSLCGLSRAHAATQTFNFLAELSFASKPQTEPSFPKTIGKPIMMQASFETKDSDEKLKKLYQNEVLVEDAGDKFMARFQIWSHRDQNGVYFSQQMFLFENNKLVSFCSAYFSAFQKYLVPSSCWGQSSHSNLMLGIAISIAK